jgi:putative glycosyl hydrolase protein
MPASAKTQIRPWLQDFSMGRTYTQADVVAQINAAERGGAKGWLLWNADVEYHDGALAN